MDIKGGIAVRELKSIPFKEANLTRNECRSRKCRIYGVQVTGLKPVLSMINATPFRVVLFAVIVIWSPIPVLSRVGVIWSRVCWRKGVWRREREEVWTNV